MIVALDAMGGDFAPANTVQGAVMLVRERPDVDVIMTGPEEILAAELKRNAYDGARITIVNATEVVEMDESPSLAIRRKKDSSLRRAVELVRDGKADAAISAGNSGAMMALALYLIGMAKGVERPAIASEMPSEHGSFLLLDMGANVDCTPEHLLQFALMGNAYTKHVLGVAAPRVALLSIGEEPAKGNELTKDAFKLLEKSHLKFIGNIESKEIFAGGADVVVCDGFVGNVFLKTSEGLAEVVMKMLKREVMASTLAKIGYLLMRSALKKVMKRMDYDEYGGAPLLGLNGACVISHGRASGKAIKNGIIKAAEFAGKQVHVKISEEISSTNITGDTVAAG
jgi:glycerol-3-phosphate acyltransferase PlsX